MSYNIVFLVGSYYPNYSAVGRCQGNIADEFEKQGHNVTVIAIKTRIDEVETEYLGNQRIIRVTNKYFYERLNAERRNDSIGKLLSYCLRARNAAKKIFSTDSLRKCDVETYYNALKNLDFIPDLIVPTCLPFETVVAATKYKLEVGRSRVVPVLYDMFAENAGLTLTTWNKRFKEKRNLTIEKSAFELCDRILHMPSWTPHLKAKHAELMDKTAEVEHPLVKEPILSQEKVFSDGINLAFTGAVDSNIRNPQPVLELFFNYNFPGVRMHFYAMGNAVDKIQSASKQCSTIVYHGKVDSAYAHRVISDANILISIGNTVLDQFPSKIFEYMSAGKPIIHFFYLDKDPAIDVLRKYPLSLCVSVYNIQYECVRSFIAENQDKEIDFSMVQKLFKNASPETICIMLTEK